jgi:hypothetical protein
MYKKFFMGIAAMAALTLVSCSSDDLNSLSDNSSKNEAISFDGYLGRSAVAVNGTRGSVLEIDDLKKSEDGFGVFGNYNSTGGQNFGSNLFNNQPVTYKTSAWTYSPLKYWSTQGHIDFLAYAPYDSNQKLIENSKLEFKVSPTATEQKDLLWANAKDQKKANNPVKFTFNHALAKIGYTVKTNVADDNVIITLNKITLAGSTTDPKVGAFYTKGFINLSKDLSKAGDATELWTNREGKQCLTWSTGFPDVTSSPVSKPDYLFVIPQDFSTGTNELYVIVDYTISYKKGATATMTSTVSSNKIIKNFEQGKAYTINLNIGLTKIDFDVTDVKTWTPAGDGKIDIDSWN